MTRKELGENDKKRELQMLAELTKFHQDNALRLAALGNPTAIVDNVLASTITKKRIRFPQVDLDVHPFCLDRQIADEFERINYNKNPRFYDPSVTGTPRLNDLNLHNHSSLISNVDALEALSPRLRPEFDAVVAPASYQPGIDSIPKLATVDVASPNLMGATQTIRLAVSNYGKTIVEPKPKSFGHRPQSASRMFNPISQSVGHDQPAQPSPCAKIKPTNIRTGMSVMKLENLLHPERKSPLNIQPKSKQRANKANSKSLVTTTKNANANAFTELEKQYNNSLYLPKPAKKPVHNPAPLDQTTAELMVKYRKMAIGIQRDI